jgi:hypothetical protein
MLENLMRKETAEMEDDFDSEKRTSKEKWTRRMR